MFGGSSSQMIPIEERVSSCGCEKVSGSEHETNLAIQFQALPRRDVFGQTNLLKNSTFFNIILIS